MENRKGNGIFLGIVSVATLIVAIIGATFAYFSASTESNTNAVGLSAYEFNLSLSVNPIYPKGVSGIIPLNAKELITTNEGKNVTYNTNGEIVNATDQTAEENKINNLQYAVNGAQNICVDSQGLQVCAIYEVTVYNQAVNELELNGQLKTTKNVSAEGVELPDGVTDDGFNNLTYWELEGDPDSGFKLVGEPTTIEAKEEGIITIGNVTVGGATLRADGSVETPGEGKSYILVYLEDNENQSYEMGATFEGQLIYSSGELGDTGLTGKFTVSANDDTTDPEEEPTGE